MALSLSSRGEKCPHPLACRVPLGAKGPMEALNLHGAINSHGTYLPKVDFCRPTVEPSCRGVQNLSTASRVAAFRERQNCGVTLVGQHLTLFDFNWGVLTVAWLPYGPVASGPTKIRMCVFQASSLANWSSRFSGWRPKWSNQRMLQTGSNKCLLFLFRQVHRHVPEGSYCRMTWCLGSVWE